MAAELDLSSLHSLDETNQARIQGGARRARAPPSSAPQKKEGRKGKERKEKEKGKEKERHLDVIISSFVPI